jgi:c-di-GMP-related signal transduction protein
MIEENKEIKIDKSLQEIVVTRLPIFDKNKDVFAYELLFKADTGFRKRVWDYYRNKREQKKDSAASSGVDSLFITGLKKLTGGKLAVINFDNQMLVNNFPMMFPSELLGIELGDGAQKNKHVTEAVKKLKEAGYLLFINDDFFNEGQMEIIKMADIIGVDFRSPGLQKRFSVFHDDHRRPRFLARSVETASDYHIAAEKGYQYFQGEFFSTAEVIAVKNIPSYKTNLLRILKEINKPSIDIAHIEEILKRDVSITYKLLRFVNSAKFGLKTTVQSIQHALRLLGEKEVKNWLSLMVLSGMGTDKPHELLTGTLSRAKLCESLALRLQLEQEMPNYFLLGMLSMVDVFLSRPMEEIMDDLPLSSELKSALKGENNQFRDVLDLVTEYERGRWYNVSLLTDKLGLQLQDVGDLYLEAIEWGKFL